MARAADDFHIALATSLPSHLQLLSLLRPRLDPLGEWQLLPSWAVGQPRDGHSLMEAR
jgi:hypothetical protein